MKPFQTFVDLDGNAKETKIRVCYHERDSAFESGRSAEVTVYVDRTGMVMPDDLPKLSELGTRSAQEFLHQILRESGSGGTS